MVTTRYYTIRAIDAAAGWLDMDFVLHAAAGPACDFARRARPGDRCAISGPCGLGIKPARHYLLAGDETALPAIARIAETLPSNATGRIFLEGKRLDDFYAFHKPEGVEIQYCLRQSDQPQSPSSHFLSATSAAIRSLAGDEGVFFWLAGSFSAYEAFRPVLTDIPKSRTINVPYWRHS